MRPTLVFGHRNPDSDSICSAVAYAHLKNRTDREHVHVPMRLGPMPPESAWLFDRFQVETPDLLEHVRLRARDVMATDLITATPEDPLLVAGRVMQEHGIRSLPVVDDGVATGLVTMSILARRYVGDLAVRGFGARPVRAGRLAEVLDGEIVEGDADTRLAGDVLIGAMEPETMLTYISPGDTLVVGDRKRSQPMALEAGVACLVITGGATPEDAVRALARERGAVLIVTRQDTYGAARLINLSDPVSGVMETDLVRVRPDDLLAEVSEDLFASPQREAVVEDVRGQLVGLITRSSIARAHPRRVVLVDHNETSQSAPGIQEAAVAEIVDHHRVGDVQTAAPALFLNLPVGSTATIVAERYRELGVDIPEPMTGLLLGAVLSDTVLLKSPTTTGLDRKVAEELAERLGEDLTGFGMELFRARSSATDFSIERVVTGDLKHYRVGETSVAIGQVETVDLEEVLGHRDALLDFMDEYRENQGHDLVLLMVTDVVREGTELLASGRSRLVERVFDVSLEGGSAWLPGILSRKKQVAARLLEAAGR